MSSTLTIDDFIDHYRQHQLLMIDSRSEGEYEHGHIPGAVNIPLLNNEHRIIIGTLYKKEGRQAAIQKGFELVGPLFQQMIQTSREQLARQEETSREQLARQEGSHGQLAGQSSNEVMLYCWRGGMRSGIMAWLLTTAGFKVTLLKGGYKTYRRWCLNQFELKRNIIILGGKTGSGKTEMLDAIKNAGEQVVCLESVAHHKGSAYGALGQLPQPAQEHFENNLAWKLSETAAQKLLWLENESRNIGFVQIPEPLFNQMRNAIVVQMEVDIEVRMNRILHEYGHFPTDVLVEITKKLQKRMGGQNVKAAVECLLAGDKRGWLEKLLTYYDNTYTFGNEQRDKSSIFRVTISWQNKEVEAKQIILQSKSEK